MQIEEAFDKCQSAICDLELACMENCKEDGREDTILGFCEDACNSLTDAVKVATGECPECGVVCNLDTEAETEPMEALYITGEVCPENVGIRLNLFTSDNDLVEITPFFDVEEIDGEFEIGKGLVEALRELADQVERKGINK